jgi:CBS-domain-containing membrane protein
VNFEGGNMLNMKITESVVSGVGGGIGIFLLSILTLSNDAPLLMAPFGASCVLLFSVPESPLSQPKNVIGGHLISSLVGVIFVYMLPATPVVIALAVALAITLMSLMKVTHPPAGADPIVILLGAKGFSFLLFPVLSGSILLVVVALAFHRITGHYTYPSIKSVQLNKLIQRPNNNQA